MKKNIPLIAALFIGIAAAILSISSHESKVGAQVSVQASDHLGTANVQTTVESTVSLSDLTKAISTQEDSMNSGLKNVLAAKYAGEEAAKTVALAAEKPKTATLSRGGNLPEVSKPKKKVEMLDWWKSARDVFPIGSVVTVKDVYTGKTFKIKRTMGANHADCEALTLEDTKIIKSIWGGFSWDVRPVHIYINGRILAASMAGQPHAGVDSAPAYAVVDNRSEGYGRGENLDTIKGNGMDGHFDVHFLNSTHHFDGKLDSRHQAAVKVASNSPE
ncbi:MAG: hypothetical protein Q8930_13625 [Bacillota bacterium]|nr:hypothetical protein [Bacillota bacterium]